MTSNEITPELIEISKLVKDAIKKGVNFGKGDPYNRLRYYTKIGLLPHMERKKTKSGETKGHYPNWVLDKLIKIETLKNSGMQNEDMIKFFEKETRNNVLKNVFKYAESRKKIIVYGIALIVLLVAITELQIIPVGKSKTDLVNQARDITQVTVVEQGEGLFTNNRKQVFVKSSAVYNNSNIQVTFKGDYSPATRYWISKINPQEGFYLELDSPTLSDVTFNWWIIE